MEFVLGKEILLSDTNRLSQTQETLKNKYMVTKLTQLCVS